MNRDQQQRGCDLIVETLAQAGLELCIANPGTTEMWFVKSLADCKRIKSVLGLHETVCSGACDGYARMKRKPALCLLHMGPGFANAISNLHNAKRARSPVVVLVGDMAQWHMFSHAPLCMDIRRLAETVSSSVIVPSSTSELQAAAEQAYTESASYTEDALNSRVATLIVSHDLSWEPTSNDVASGLSPVPPLSMTGSTTDFLNACIERMQATSRGRLAFLIGGIASIDDQDAITMVGKIAASVQATIYCENSFARVDRGYGRPYIHRLPYFPQDAVHALKQYSMIVTFDCRLPVAQFGYENGPSDIITIEEEDIWQLDSGELTLPIIQYLYTKLDAKAIIPGKNCRGVFCPEQRPEAPSQGVLTANALCASIARHQPKAAIIVDESITSGSSYWDYSKSCPAFTHLTLTGGAIGCGPALSVGAALACPDRMVINIQADGSALYSLQALWTQAKEKLSIVTVICSNRTYAILKLEVSKQGIRGLQGSGLSTLTDISNPVIDWVSLANGMGIKAIQVATIEDFSHHLNKALNAKQGPFLIEAII